MGILMMENKILCVNNTPIDSGIGKYALNMEKLGFEVVSIISQKDKLNRNYTNNKIYGIYPPFMSGWAINSEIINILIKLKSKNSNRYYHYLTPMNTRFHNKNNIITFHDLYFMHRKNFEERYFYYLYNKLIKIKQNNLISVSENTMNEMIDFGFNENNITVIYPYIDDKIFFKISNIEKENFVLTVGDGIFKNNIYICDLLHKNNIKHIHIGKEVKLNHYGNNRYITNISENQMNEYYNKANLVIRASKYEGFGYPIIESIFAGTNVLTSDINTFKEFLSYKYYNDIYSDNFINKINDLMNHNIDNDFRNKIINMFSQKKFFDKIVYYYNGLI